MAPQRSIRSQLFVVVTSFVLPMLLACSRTNGISATPKENEPGAIRQARSERDLYKSRGDLNRGIYWFLSIAAAGTAISTAIRTVYSPARDTGKDANGRNLPAGTMDGVLLCLAVGTIVSTTALSTVNPQELATRDSFGQLTLEKALFQYDAHIGPATQDDVDKVTEAYFEAEDVLENGLQAFAKQQPAPKPDNQPDKPADATPANAPKDTKPQTP